jgi:phosphohistidine phosphatase
MTSRLLMLLRHAKSSWADPNLADHDRPLNERGRKAAALVGHHLGQAEHQPDLVLCSDATRTRETLQLLDLPRGTEAVIENGLYGAPATDLLSRVRQVPARYRSVLVIGHNPGIEDLARMLDRDGLDSVEKFPTAAVAILRFARPAWGEITAGAGRLDTFFTPRELAAPDRLA